ncbi:MAG: carbon-nitrogen hydrolase family protein [Actinobacteria bacterium]|nr:carbon-nitrogen hydrolase family protein [Actinomycetota bacterium]
MSKFKIALLQLKVKENKEENLKNASDMIYDAARGNADIIILPEMFNCPYDNSFFGTYAEKYPGITAEMLSGLSKKLSVYIVGGSIPEKDDEGRIYNTSFVFDRNGRLAAKHRKIHLFDVCIENGICFKESAVLSHGKSMTVFETEFCKAGVAICYDIRFPELIRKMTLEGAGIIIVPAAFNMTTGPAHWHVTARARAIDNQVYIVLASPARNPKSPYIAYGHSMAVNPWGKIISEATTGQQIIFAEIDPEYMRKIRQELPLLKHRRTDY